MTNFEAFHKLGANRVYYSIVPEFWDGAKVLGGGGGMAPLDPILPPFLFHLAFSEEWSTTGQNW